MPRSQKLVAALGLAIVAYLVSIQVLPQLPEGGQYTGLTLSNMVIGLIVGWIVMGNRSPSRVVTPLTNGLTGVLSLVLWALFVHSCEEMITRAMNRRYSGPFTALVDIFDIATDYALYLFTPGIALTLVVGAMVVGALTARAARLYG